MGDLNGEVEQEEAGYRDRRLVRVRGGVRERFSCRSQQNLSFGLRGQSGGACVAQICQHVRAQSQTRGTPAVRVLVTYG